MSADQQFMFKRTFIANEAMTSAQYQAVTLSSTNGSVDLADSAGEACLGIVQNAPASGAPASVCMMGICKAEVGGTVTFGARLQADSDAQLIAAATGDFVVAIALDDGADGDLITVFVVPSVPYDA